MSLLVCRVINRDSLPHAIVSIPPAEASSGLSRAGAQALECGSVAETTAGTAEPEFALPGPQRCAHRPLVRRRS